MPQIRLVALALLVPLSFAIPSITEPKTAQEKSENKLIGTWKATSGITMAS
jgi:hypothetical protein